EHRHAVRGGGAGRGPVAAAEAALHHPRSPAAGAGDLWRHGRPGAPQAHPRHLPPLAAEAPPRGLCCRRGGARADGRRGVPAADEGRAGRVRHGAHGRRVGRVRRAALLREPRLRRRGGLRAAQGAAQGGRSRVRHPQQPPVLLRGAAAGGGRDLARPGAGGDDLPARVPVLDAGHRGEAVRTRPGVGAGAEHGAAGGLRRAADLPHRPLPGEGNAPEHDGVPLRQLRVGAAVEPQPHRPRADHGRGDRGAGDARRLLRAERRAARHGAEPPAADPHAGGDGAPGLVRRGLGAQREGQGAARHPPHAGRGHRPGDGARPVHRRGRRQGVPPGRRRRAGVAHGDLCGGAHAGGQLAVGGRALLPAHGEAPPGQGHGGGGQLPPRAAPGDGRGGERAPRAQRAGAAHPAQGRDLALLRGQGPGPRRPPAGREHGLRLRHRVQGRRVPGGLPAPPAGRDARRRHPFRPPRRGGGRLDPGHPHPGALGSFRRARGLPRRKLGPRRRRPAAGGGWEGVAPAM
ncbi:MAG: Glucose-6-phosphate 1-dehydrogenase, partial [uncultured Gemmatimonadetes bacterium]